MEGCTGPKIQAQLHPASGPLIQLSADHKAAPNRLVGAFRSGPDVWNKAAQNFYSDDMGRTWTVNPMKQVHMDESEVKSNPN